MKIKQFMKPSEQMAVLGNLRWSVSRLFELSKDLPVMDIPINHMNTYHKFTDLTMREFITHMRAVENADLTFPIILDEDGEIMDGRHRLMKAIITGEKTIKAVRFEENPTACQVGE